MAERLSGGTGARARKSGVRKLLLDEQRRRTGPKSRWHMSGPDEYETALASGRDVVVSSEALFTALHNAGQNADDFAYGGQHFRGMFHVSGADIVTPWTDDDATP